MPAQQVGVALPKGNIGTRLKHILPLLVLIYTCLIFAPEAAVTISNINMTSYRAVILLLLVPCLLPFIRGQVRLGMPDCLLAAGSIWMLLAFAILYGPADGLVRASGVIIDTLGGYLIARASIRSYIDFRIFLVIVAPGFFLAGVVLGIESLSTTIFYRPAFASVFGSSANYVDGNAASAIQYQVSSRLGLLRGYSTFSHPILAGVTLASLLPLYFNSGVRSWPLWLGISAAFLCIFSVSSIALLMLVICIAMMLVDKHKSKFRFVNWPVISLAGVALLLMAQIGSQSGVAYIIIRYTFDPANGYVRIIQWEASLAAMRDAPWFGIGYQRVAQLPDWLPPSIDSHFLVLALRSGWVSCITLYLAGLWILISLGLNIDRYPPGERNLIVGLNFAIFLLMLASLTVAYFGETNVYFMAILGIGAAMAQFPRYKKVKIWQASPSDES